MLAYSFFSDAAKALIACTATTLTCQNKKKCEHLCHPDLDHPNNLIQVCFPLCWKVQKWTQLHVSDLLLPVLAADEDSIISLAIFRYSHDGKLQPCKFLFGRGKCEHGSSCRFSHSTPSPEALAMVQDQWKNGGIKVAKETIESCALMAFDSFMSLNG